ncbi:uncharacterized protein [Epargyreus clarus]|uniref:uncharacterized protein n=1 Tax=Epargyreus clarus TaxID=520877 RepID=UPI003C2D880C
MRALILLVALSLAAIANAGPSGRIVGGFQTVIEQYPFSAALLNLQAGNNFRQRCGGSIINNRAILTAAHCLEGSSNAAWRIRVGSTNAHSGGVLHQPNRITIHPNYRRATLDSDIALLRSSTNYVFNQRVRPGSIAGSNYNVPDNTGVWAIGWGATAYMGVQAEQLRHVQILTINQSSCRNSYAVIPRTVTDNMLCTGWTQGFRGQCHGDSGSPVIHGNVIVGVTSWGEMCAQPRFPSVNVRVNRFTSWITSNNGIGIYRSRVGSTWAHSGGSVHNTVRIANQPNWNPCTLDNDITLLQVASVFPLGVRRVTVTIRAAPSSASMDSEPDHVQNPLSGGCAPAGWTWAAVTPAPGTLVDLSFTTTISKIFSNMHRVTVLFLLGLSAVIAASEERIVGGSVTTIDRYPFAVAILRIMNNNWIQNCGGTIINNRSVLSAAHCFSGNAGNFRSRVGSTWAHSGGSVHNTARIANHPNYNPRTLDNDISVIRVASVFALGGNVRAGSIAGSNYNLADNQAVWAIGWGLTSFGGAPSEQLRQVQIWTVNQNTCRTRYTSAGFTITDNMLCAGWLDVGGRDTCSRDSGGPLIHNNVIVGVVSFGNRCALPRYPGVYARVSRYTSWIQGNA